MSNPDAPAVSIRRVSSTDVLPIRHSVLWPDRPPLFVVLPEDDAGFHYGAFVNEREGEKLIAVISIFNQRLPIPNNDTPSLQFRKFACLPDYRGQGVGSMLLEKSIQDAKALQPEPKPCKAWCDARSSTKAWYEKRGMQELQIEDDSISDRFFKGDIEYLRMVINI